VSKITMTLSAYENQATQYKIVKNIANDHFLTQTKIQSNMQ